MLYRFPKLSTGLGTSEFKMYHLSPALINQAKTSEFNLQPRITTPVVLQDFTDHVDISNREIDKQHRLYDRCPWAAPVLKA